MKAYLCKYIPPRQNFLETMTADEAELMKQHSEWQTSLLEQGLIIAHGPVIDPKGSYGVALFRLPDDQDIAELTAQDPIVVNGAGHYEHYPMLQLKARA